MRNLKLLVSSYFLSNLGAQLLTIGLAFASYQSSGNGYLAGIILMLHYLPGGFISIFGGRLTNIIGLKHTLAFNNVITVVASITLLFCDYDNPNHLFYFVLFLKNFAHQFINVLKGSAIKYAFDAQLTKNYGSKIQMGYTLGSTFAGILCLFFYSQIDIGLLLIINILTNLLTLIFMLPVSYSHVKQSGDRTPLKKEIGNALSEIIFNKSLFGDFNLSILSVGLLQAPLFYYRNIFADGLWSLGTNAMGVLHIITTLGILAGLYIYKKLYSGHHLRFEHEITAIGIFNLILLLSIKSNFLGAIAILFIAGLCFELIYMHFFIETVAHSPKSATNTILCLRAGLAQAAAGIGSYFIGLINLNFGLTSSLLIMSILSLLTMGLFFYHGNFIRILLLKMKVLNRRKESLPVRECRRSLQVS